MHRDGTEKVERVENQLHSGPQAQRPEWDSRDRAFVLVRLSIHRLRSQPACSKRYVGNVVCRGDDRAA